MISFPLISFCLGLAIGFVIFYGRERRLKRRLKQILRSLSLEHDTQVSLSITWQVRRQFYLFEELVKEQKQELQACYDLIAKIPLGYLQVDKDNQLLFCNHKAQELLKITSWQNHPIRLLLELVRSYELDQLIQKTRQYQQPQVDTWEFYTKDSTNQNQIKAITLTGYSFPLLKGKVGVFIENKQPIIEAERLRERAFSDLTHELRTPLTAINLVGETLEQRLENPEKKWVTKMLKETKRLIELVENWLELSLINDNPAAFLNYQSLSLREVILTAWQTIEPLAMQKRITLDLEGDKDVEIEGDRSRLTQVFLNLFDNNIKHSPLDSRIKLSLKLLDSNQVKIDIVDSGTGFSPQDLPYVFQRLYRGDPSRTRQQTNAGGSGLGLSIVEQIIKAHKGEVKAQNHPETGGSWLQLILPQKN